MDIGRLVFFYIIGSLLTKLSYFNQLNVKLPGIHNSLEFSFYLSHPACFQHISASFFRCILRAVRPPLCIAGIMQLTDSLQIYLKTSYVCKIVVAQDKATTNYKVRPKKMCTI